MFKSPSSIPENMEGEPDHVVTLYAANGLVGHSAGLMYDQERHQAYYAISIWEYDWASPIDENHNLWLPLETVLSNWIEMTRVGKIIASQGEVPNEKNGVWAMHSYGPKQVDTAFDAFHRLVDAIETRMPAGTLLPVEQRPLLTDGDLDAASVPEECFIRSRSKASLQEDCSRFNCATEPCSLRCEPEIHQGGTCSHSGGRRHGQCDQY